MSSNMVHFHFTQSLRAHQLQNWILVSMVQPLDSFQGPLDSHGQGSWSMWKVPLVSGVHP